MSRLPELDPAALTPEQKRIYDTIMAGPRGRVRGPLAIWLRRPELADRAQAFGQYCRFDSSLPLRLSELAILVMARLWRSEFEWWAHETHAAKAGLPASIIEAIRTNVTPDLQGDEEKIVYDITLALHRDRRLSDTLYKRGLAVLGEDKLIDLVAILGYYSLVSMTLNVFEVTPPGATSSCFD